MIEFRQGQLVAVRDYNEAEWKLRVYDHERGGLHYCRIVDGLGTVGGVWWTQVCPAEIVWPNIFLAVEREIAEALRNERDLHYRQIRWLCARLQEIGDRNGSQECPPSPHGDCRIGNCAECWELASLEAVKEGADGTSEESPALGR